MGKLDETYFSFSLEPMTLVAHFVAALLLVTWYFLGDH